jgi:glutamine amidotransferase
VPQIGIVDYGVGNLRSVEKALAAIGCAAVISSDEKVLQQAERLVLPGVGAFAACMKALRERGFDELVRERVAQRTPLLGVCVVTHPLFDGIVDGAFFYFVHSYYCEPAESEVVLGETVYGVDYASVVAHGNVCGVQFHPEKSQAVGLKLLSNFGRA